MPSPTSVEDAVRAVEPAVRFVSERHLRKVLHYLRDHGAALPLNPDLAFRFSRQELAGIDVTPRAVLAGSEDPLLLVTTPDDREVDSKPREEQLREYWRLLFQGSLGAALVQLSREDCEERLARFGPATAREIRYMLETEHRIDRQADDAAVFRAFAILYHELQAFAPQSVADFFPILSHAPEVEGIDVAGLLARCRPAGAPDLAAGPGTRIEPRITVRTARNTARALARAEQAEARGNFARAAILKTQGGQNAADVLDKLTAALGAALGWSEESRRRWLAALAPLAISAAEGSWSRAARCLYELQKIPADLSREVFAVDAVEPIRTLGRRPIKRPLPHARPVMILLKLRAAHQQLVRGGLDTAGQEPLDQLFLEEMHRVESDIRRELSPIISNAVVVSGLAPGSRIEELARDKLVAELLDRICDRGYLRFGDLRDAVARNQLKMPDLAGPLEWLTGDALLRADTQLAYDLDGVYRRGEFYLRLLQRGSSLFFGTPPGRLLFLYLIAPFLAAFLTLTFAIELKHIGGTVYAFTSKILSGQPSASHIAASASAAATASSTYYFWDEDGQLASVEFDEYDWDQDGNLVREDEPLEADGGSEGGDGGGRGNLISIDPNELFNTGLTVATSSVVAAPGTAEEAHGSAFPRWESVLALGLFLLLTFHVPPFQRAVISALSTILNGFWQVFFVLPDRVLRSPAMIAVRYSPPIRFLGRCMGGAIVATSIVLVLLWVLGASKEHLLRWGGIAFGLAILGFNTPWGRDLQDRVAESLADGWRIMRVNLWLGLVATVLDWFRRLANWFERRLYAVDEWLRFRGGDSQGSLAVKAMIGLFWFPFAYFSRFAFNLLLEPQINPVKHFPVVTVSHKVLLPLVISRSPQTVPSTFGQVLVNQLGLTVYSANFWAFWIIASIPGIFGFIAWELLANWRLYGANRSARLRPVMIGSHGETMRGLLRPGFHSGTVPKLFRRLRRADHKAKRIAAAGLHHELHHLEEAVHRFVERELVALLCNCSRTRDLGVSLGRIRFGAQRVAIDLLSDRGEADPAVIAFENRSGRIAATLDRTGWIDRLETIQREAVEAAIRGFFDMAAAELYNGAERATETLADPLAAGSPKGLARHFTWIEWRNRWDGTA